jgi:hypothetical protein
VTEQSLHQQHDLHYLRTAAIVYLLRIEKDSFLSSRLCFGRASRTQRGWPEKVQPVEKRMKDSTCRSVNGCSLPPSPITSHHPRSQFQNSSKPPLKCTMEPSSTAPEEQDKSRTERKQEGKRLKRDKIEVSGGKRPRIDQNVSSRLRPTTNNSTSTTAARQPHSQKPAQQRRHKPDEKIHRFGRVMDQTPCPGKPRYSTLSIAVPGSIVSNAQTRELKTYLVSQIARAATIYHVDEIVVYDDKLSVDKKNNYHRQYQRNRARESAPKSDDAVGAGNDAKERSEQPPATSLSSSTDPHVFMARVLQYCECPQYLRRNFFPMHSDLQFAGLLPPIDAPHHVRAEDRSKYREGVVMDKCAQNTGNSFVNCGIRNRPVE